MRLVLATAYDLLGGPAVSDVTASIAPTDVGLRVGLEVQKFMIVAATLPPDGGKPEICRIETTERAIRGYIIVSAA